MEVYLHAHVQLHELPMAMVCETTCIYMYPSHSEEHDITSGRGAVWHTHGFVGSEELDTICTALVTAAVIYYRII